MTVEYFIAMAVILFCVGIVGLVSRRNIFVTYMSIELMLNAVNLVLVLFARLREDAGGSVISLLMIGVIAAEAALFLGMIVQLYRKRRTVDTDLYNGLAQKEFR